MAKASWIWKETAEIIGVLGVIASLIFVAFEIRQNTQATRSATIQDISRWSYDAFIVGVDNVELREAWRAACAGTMTEDQRQQMRWYFGALMRLQANRFYQAQLGSVDEVTAMALGGRGLAWQTPMTREFWPVLRQVFETDFQEFFEREILPLSGDSC